MHGYENGIRTRRQRHQQTTRAASEQAHVTELRDRPRQRAAEPDEMMDFYDTYSPVGCLTNEALDSYPYFQVLPPGQARPPSSPRSRQPYISSELHKAEIDNLHSFYDQRISSIHKMNQDLNAKIEHYQTSGQILYFQLEQEYGRRCAAEKLNELRVIELQEAQAYLEFPDTMSGQDVVGLVKALNSEIFQFAASVSEASPRRRTRKGHQKNTEDLDNLQSVVGANIVDVVRNLESLPDVDPELLFQTAIQVALANIAQVWTTIFDAYTFEHSETQEAIRSVHRSICRAGKFMASSSTSHAYKGAA